MPAKKKSKTVKQQSTEPASAQPELNHEQETAVIAAAVKLPEDNDKDGSKAPEVPKVVEPEQTAGTDTPRSTRSWYGAWPRKSRESVVLEQTPEIKTTRAESLRQSSQSRSIPTRKASRSLLSAGAARSLPLVATITKLNISSEAAKQAESQKSEDHDNALSNASGKAEEAKASDTTQNEDGKVGDESTPLGSSEDGKKPELVVSTAAPTSWLSWSRGDLPSLPSISLSYSLSQENKPIKAESTTAIDTEPASQRDAISPTELPEPIDPIDASSKSLQPAPASWYPRWAFGNGAVVAEAAKVDVEPPQDIPMPDATVTTTETELPASKQSNTTQRTSWVFWSKSSAQSDNARGEVAVAESSSQSKPEPSIVREESTISIVDDKKKRPLSQGDEPVKKKQASTSSEPIKKVEGNVFKEKSNILLPTFETTYSTHSENPSLWQQIGGWIYPSSPPKHTTLLKQPRKIRCALAIGVHGYFPGAIVQTLLGRPTGTSIKFADSAAKAIEDFTRKYDYTPQSIDKIALEGEGRIEERLDILWKLLLNWLDLIRKADFILVACHSQGVPVAISLVAKLIGFGCVGEAKIGICAMAGISRGPFAEYKSRWIAGSAAELFEFSDPQSKVSKAYRDALETVLRFGAKIVYIGSLDDQLVPLHSSCFTHVNHPNIYRAVFVDGRIHIADFISHLVGFALKLRNLNTSDHGLIRELSNPLAGSLVGGEGHSRIYDDPAVYNLTMDFTLRTSDVVAKFESDDTPMPSAMNPFILPFAVRGVLEEDLVRNQLSGEVKDLLQQFDKWKPGTKVLKDVKYRLEGIRSRRP